MNSASTISEAQGRHREVGSEGSVEQSCESTNRNVVGGLLLWDDSANDEEILWTGSRGKRRDCAAKVHVPIRGDLRVRRTGVCRSARHLETDGVSVQKSAEAIVADGAHAPTAKGRTVWIREES